MSSLIYLRIRAFLLSAVCHLAAALPPLTHSNVYNSVLRHVYIRIQPNDDTTIISAPTKNAFNLFELHRFNSVFSTFEECQIKLYMTKRSRFEWLPHIHSTTNFNELIPNTRSCAAVGHIESTSDICTSTCTKVLVVGRC